MVLGEPGVQSSPSSPNSPSAVLTSSSRDGRTVEVSACPSGCWVVLGEGFNRGWTARTESGSLGDPVLVDGNANGWWIGPTTQPTTVTMEWTAQPWLDAALPASLVGVLLALGLVIGDRRRDGDVRLFTPPPRPAELSERWSTRSGAATIVTSTLAGALLIGWEWGLLAAIVGAAAYAIGRSRLLGVIGVGIVIAAQLIMIFVVRDERPYPDAGWPIRFEWLHPWTLFGIVLFTCSTLFAGDAAVPRSRRAR